MERRRTGRVVASTVKIILTFLLIAALFFLFFGKRTMWAPEGIGEVVEIFSDMKNVITDGFEMAGVKIDASTPQKALNEVKKATKVLSESLDDVKEASNIIFSVANETSPYGG